MRTCHICGALVEGSQCLSCTHFVCSLCLPYVEKPTYEALQDRVRELEAQLGVAIEIFEMDDECNKVGTDAWMWLQHAHEALNAPKDDQ